MNIVIKPIRTEEDHKRALARIDEIFDAEEGTSEGDELEVLVDLVMYYESKTVEIGFPDAISAIEFRMDQANLTQRDLIPYIGSRAKVSEVLSGKRSLTMSMARMLHEHLGIPADVLLQKPGAGFDSTFEEIDPRRFPLRAMAKREWIPQLPNLADHAEELIRSLIERAGGPEVAAATLYRKNGHRRINAKTDPYALRAWCWYVLGVANENAPHADYRPGTVDELFMREVACLSKFEDGPRRAQEFLAAHGIALVVEQHLPRTHLDGAALRLSDGRPVIGLTLRYDRIDNFWFSLMHELAHVGFHLDDGDEVFVDDQRLRNLLGDREDPKEKEADKYAEDALIPRAIWETSVVREVPTVLAVIDMAQELSVHPAVVAGRVRHEKRNFRLLSQLVGAGKVWQHFEKRHEAR